MPSTNSQTSDTKSMNAWNIFSNFSGKLNLVNQRPICWKKFMKISNLTRSKTAWHALPIASKPESNFEEIISTVPDEIALCARLLIPEFSKTELIEPPGMLISPL